MKYFILKVGSYYIAVYEGKSILSSFRSEARLYKDKPDLAKVVSSLDNEDTKVLAKAGNIVTILSVTEEEEHYTVSKEVL